jgi:hypothetical protein
LYVFSTSTEFEAERGYSKFSAYALLDHGRDFQAAAKALGQAGYGRANTHGPGSTSSQDWPPGAKDSPGDPPTTPLDEEGMRWWWGYKAVWRGGERERRATLRQIARILAEADANEISIAVALEDRDEVLGLNVCTRFNDRAARYRELARQAMADARSRPTGDGSGDRPTIYRLDHGGIVWLKDGAPVPLSNFSCEITGEVAQDDGLESRMLLVLKATLEGRSTTFFLPAREFVGMSWVVERLGAKALMFPGFGLRDHLRAAIQEMSADVVKRTVFAHTGWRKIDGAWAYLHADGAIGPVGPVLGVEVSLPQALERFSLPDPPTGPALKEAIKASLKFLSLAPDSVTFPMYAAPWRAVLGGADHSNHVVGPTGAGKTEVAALLQQHFGSEWNARKLPGTWLSTGNALEGLAFTAKDALFVVDDFTPTGTAIDVQKMHREADRILRAQGNTSGRQRMRSDSTLRPTKPPRGLIFSTGEDTPRGESLRSRLLVQQLPKEGPGSLDWEKLTECQQDATAGLCAGAMAGFLRWLAPRYETVSRGLKGEIASLRAQAYESGQHRRTPEIVASLAVGFRYFLAFAKDSGALTAFEAGQLWERAWKALGEAAGTQSEHQADSEPTRRFLALLSASLASGRAHIANPEGQEPDGAEAWG